MTDYLAKARQGRVVALNQSRSGSEMFFPEEMGESLNDERLSRRRAMSTMSKPMFVRSSSVRMGAIANASRTGEVANDPLVLTAEYAVENVLRRAA